MPLVRQQCFVAHKLDSSGRLLEAFRLGEAWAVERLCNMAALDFYLSLFSLPEYGDAGRVFFPE